MSIGQKKSSIAPTQIYFDRQLNTRHRNANHVIFGKNWPASIDASCVSVRESDNEAFLLVLRCPMHHKRLENQR